MLMRGKLHVEVFDENFPGETPEGASMLVARARTAVNRRFQSGAAQPSHIMVDRGRGFYSISTGRITYQFEAALREHSFTNLMGDDAGVQPGHMQEIMLHETAVAWIRGKLVQTLPAQCWLETRKQYESRLKRDVDDINAQFDVAGLCFGLPDRLCELVSNKGGRLRQ